MAYRLKLDHSPQKNVRRIILTQIDAAEQRLAAYGDKAEAIHESRKGFKRIRSLLRLVRAAIGEAAFKRENAAFRDIANLLAGSRDRHVLLQTIALIEKAEDGSLSLAAAAMRKKLASSTGSPQPARREATSIERAVQDLSAAKERIAQLTVAGKDFTAFEDGLRRTYERAAHEMAAAARSGVDEDFHEWRKSAQQHWRHMKLMSPAWPRYFGMRAEAARDLSQLLGQDHDLALLVAFARDRHRSGLAQRQAEKVADACRAMQQKLRAEAADQGRVLFAGKPKAFTRHVAGIWAAASANPPST